MSHEAPEIPVEHLLERHDRFGRWVAIAIVLTTLGAALAAYEQSGALLEHDEANVRADQFAALSSEARARWARAAALQVARSQLARHERINAERAYAERRLGTGHGRDLELTERRWRWVAAQTVAQSHTLAGDVANEFKRVEELTDGSFPDAKEALERGSERPTGCSSTPWSHSRPPSVPSNGPARFGPDQDPDFPNRYLAGSRYESYRFDALRDAANEEGQTAQKQFTRYAVCLTMFAVAVFLFGYSLTPHASERRGLYAGWACAFVVVSTGWGIFAAVHRPREPPLGAAVAYADAQVAADGGDDRRAIQNFSCAIALRPSFVQAYIGRAGAYDHLGAVTNTSVATSLTAPSHTKHALDDYRAAQERGSRDPLLLANLAFDLFVVGVAEDDRNDLAESARLSGESIRTMRNNPIPAFNRGLALLALGRNEAACGAYRDAELRASHASIPAQGYVSGALTDLEMLRTSKSGQRIGADAVAAAKEHIVRSLEARASCPFGASAEPAEAASARAMRLRVSPAVAEVELPRGTPDDLWASPQWYYHSPLGWAAVESLSGTAESDEGSHGAVELSHTLSGSGSGCLGPGEYRVELYESGRLIQRSETRVPRRSDELVATWMRNLGVGLCRPAHWKRMRSDHPGFVDGYRDRSGTAGVLAFDISPERPALAQRSRVGCDEMRRLLVRSVDRLSAELPSGLRVSHQVSTDLFMPGWRCRVAVGYSYPAGRLIAGAATNMDGQILLAATFGPRRMFEAPGDDELSLAERVLFSFR